MRLTKFKTPSGQAPLRAGTPPPPSYEPLSPVLPPTDLALADPAGGGRISPRQPSHAAVGSPQRPPISIDVRRARPHPASVSAGYEPPLRSAPLPRARHHAPDSPTLGSPIDALADAAISIHPNPAKVANRAPRALSHTHTDVHYAHSERPSKRARSEFYHSPQYTSYQSRPATSHISGYNVEQMVNNGVRRYHDNGFPPQYPDEKRLSDAQLLLDFSFAALKSTPSRTSNIQSPSFSKSEPRQPFAVQTNEIAQALPGPPVSDVQESFHESHHDYTPIAMEVHKDVLEVGATAPAVQIHTPPEDISHLPASTLQAAELNDFKKAKKHQGWPKGKPRGPRTSLSGNKRRKSTPRPKAGPPGVIASAPEQLQSPQSLPAEGPEIAQPEIILPSSRDGSFTIDTALMPRRHSSSYTLRPETLTNGFESDPTRARSVPPATSMTTTPMRSTIVLQVAHAPGEEPLTICAGCNSSDSEVIIGEGEQWINCDGCKGWYHFVCAGFRSEREVRDVDKFYCGRCSPKFGKTTKVRKSARTHTAVDYAGLNEGIMKSSDDNPEHHYIKSFKNGDIILAKETFARFPPELVSADFLEKTNGFKEPIVIPAASNPRRSSTGEPLTPLPVENELQLQPGETSDTPYCYEMVPDDGQDKIDMVIPAGLTVRRVAELYGPMERVDVIDVKLQEGESGKWTMSKWADYYEQPGEKPVRNVISLEVSQSKLGRLIRRPKAVRDLDLQDSVWPEGDKANAPKVQFYCLMSVADAYTDFHIDFGGSSVYYHILKGRKTFFFIQPTKQNLKKYEDWCLSPRQSHEFLGDQVKECYRVDLYPGDTMLIPSGWIHAVWTPEDSLVIGGNFLTRIHYSMQIKVAEVEKNTKVAKKFRYPFFQKLMWLSLIKYIEEDPLPLSIAQLLQSGGQFKRDVPLYCEPNKFGHNSNLGQEWYNARYYPKAELDGLPDLANYIWRTVMISLGKIEGIPQTTKNAVTRSIPKGHGEPLKLARRFAMWLAWKRGNEKIPHWAMFEPGSAETLEVTAEKKFSAADIKRMERETLSEAPDIPKDKQQARRKSVGQALPMSAEAHSQSNAAMPLTGFLRPTRENSRFLTSPKTSQLGPKRIACDACRKRRIRCKHKDELVELPKWEAPPPGPITGSAGNGPMTTSWSLGTFIPRQSSDESPPATSASDAAQMSGSQGTAPITGGPISPDVNYDGLANRSGRVKACPDCRKSKRRCIHDENGNVDPVKASEAPVPRGSASKKRRVSEEDSFSTSKRLKEAAGAALDGMSLDGENYGELLRTPSRDGMAEHHAGFDQYTPGPFRRRPSSPDLMHIDSEVPLNSGFHSSNSIPIDPSLFAPEGGVMVSIEGQNQYAEEDTRPVEDRLMDAMEGVVATHHVVQVNQELGPPPPQAPVMEPLTPPPLSTSVPLANGISEYSRAGTAESGQISAPFVATIEADTTPRTSVLEEQGTAYQRTRTITLTTPTGPRSSAKSSSSARKNSRTPGRHPSSQRKSATPKTPSSKGRMDSTIKLEVKEPSGVGPVRVGSEELKEAVTGNDVEKASLALALQLQMEEHGLRRRSK